MTKSGKNISSLDLVDMTNNFVIQLSITWKEIKKELEEKKKDEQMR